MSELGLVLVTVAFFVFIISLSMGVPFYIYLKKDMEMAPPKGGAHHGHGAR